MTVTTESGGRQNAFPTEVKPYIDESISYESYAKNAEKINGRWAMVGLVAGFYILCNNRQLFLWWNLRILISITNSHNR